MSYLLSVLKKLWKCRVELKVNFMDRNVLLFVQNNLKLVCKHSLWSFDGSLHVLKYYMVGMVAFEISFCDCLFWVHVKGVSLKFFIGVAMAKFSFEIKEVMKVIIVEESG